VAICSFSLAVNRSVKKAGEWIEEVSFFDVVLFGRQGEALSKYLLKGKQVGVQGELRQNRWEQDGQKRSKIVIAANNVQLLGGNPQGQSGQQSQPRQEERPQAKDPAAFDPGYEDDIPF
jgi:single-strand DNA-binding protein